MYQRDGDVYTDDRGRPHEGVVAVGWLDASHAVAHGSCESVVVERLTALLDRGPVRQTRGYHDCSFCPADSDPPVVAGRTRVWTLGSAELWVPTPRVEGGYFAAPTLIVHYVERHGYLPPLEFREALMRLDVARFDPRVVDARWRL